MARLLTTSPHYLPSLPPLTTSPHYLPSLPPLLLLPGRRVLGGLRLFAPAASVTAATLLAAAALAHLPTAAATTAVTSATERSRGLLRK